jgi:hypothetical protein
MYGCVVGFADGDVAVTVCAGLALVGKAASGDTLRRGVIPVQRHAAGAHGQVAARARSAHASNPGATQVHSGQILKDS